jgi:hypothetical protein
MFKLGIIQVQDKNIWPNAHLFDAYFDRAQCSKIQQSRVLLPSQVVSVLCDMNMISLIFVVRQREMFCHLLLTSNYVQKIVVKVIDLIEIVLSPR